MLQRQLGELIHAGDGEVRVVELGDHLQHAPEFAKHRSKRVELFLVCPTTGYRQRLRVDVDEAGAQADRACFETRSQHPLHRRDFVRGRRALLRRIAHHPQPDHAVSNQRCNVDGKILRERIAITREALPGPFECLRERGIRQFFNLLKHTDETVAMFHLQRRER